MLFQASDTKMMEEMEKEGGVAARAWPAVVKRERDETAE